MSRVMSILVLTLAVAAAGCDPIVQRKFDVQLTDRTKTRSATATVTIDGQLAEVNSIVEDVARRWNFEASPLDDASRRIGYVAAWERSDTGGGLSLNLQVQHGNHAVVYLNFAFGTKETPTMRDVRHDLMQRLVDRFGADRVRLTGVWDKKSLRT